MNKHEAIMRVYPQIKIIVGKDAFDENNNQIQYDEEQVQAYIVSQAYKDQRAQAYPSFADQFDLLYHGGYDAWRAAIDAVKQEFPKP